jgi:hypothetical protein
MLDSISSVLWAVYAASNLSLFVFTSFAFFPETLTNTGVEYFIKELYAYNVAIFLLTIPYGYYFVETIIWF